MKTGHDEFDQIFTVHTDDEALALGAVDAAVREALLGIPGAALVCDEASHARHRARRRRWTPSSSTSCGRW